VVSGLRALSGSSPPPVEGELIDWSAEIDRQNQRATVYDELYEILQPCFRSYEDWITEAVYSAWYEGRGRLLVVGCGTGTLLQRLVQRMPARLITAIDVSPRMAQRAREKAPAVGDIRTSAFDRYRPAVPFDAIAFAGALAAMPDMRAVVNHTAGMTLHGSRVVICVRNGDWVWQDSAQRQRAQLSHPSWYWKRWINGNRIDEISSLAESLASPHALLTAGRISSAFAGRFGLRDERTDFGVTRLFETVIAVPREQSLQTVGQTRERRPWMASVERLRKLDEVFTKRHPMGGGLLAMLFDKLH
jgi:SAM-dependent methyltransferase